MMWHIITHIMQPYFLSNVQLFLVDSVDITRHIEADRHVGSSGLYVSDFHWGSEFRLAMTDRATIAGMEVAKLVSGV